LQDVKYARASTVQEAISLLSQGGDSARVLAGGTDIIVQARERRRPVSLFVDIKPIPETQQLTYDADAGLTIGAATPCYIIYNNDTVKRLYPALIEASTVIGGVAIQGRASLGGNLCNSGPAADSVPAMMVLQGTANIAGPNGTRSVPIEEFNTAPGQNVLQAGEFVVSLHFPSPAPNSGAAWERFIPRNEMDIAVTNAATYIRFEGNNVSAARIALGAVAPTALMVPDAVSAIVG
jgi:carbon-monoxide dehydrogenase medium subunit